MANLKKTDYGVTVGTRVPTWVKEFYRRRARADERKPAFLIRKVLVDHAKRHTTKEQRNGYKG